MNDNGIFLRTRMGLFLIYGLHEITTGEAKETLDCHFRFGCPSPTVAVSGSVAQWLSSTQDLEPQGSSGRTFPMEAKAIDVT
jgi:hypothetical protein